MEFYKTQKDLMVTFLFQSTKPVVVFCIFFGIHVGIFGQPNLQELKAMYPGQHELVLKEKQSYEFNIRKDKPVIKNNNYYESIILSELGSRNNAEVFTYSELVPLKSFDAYTIVAKDGKEKKVPINQVTEKKADSRSVFYSDVMEKKLVFNHLDVGAKKVYTYESEFLDHHLLHRFMFAGSIPVEESVFEIIADKDIEIGYKVFNDHKNEVTLKVEEKKKKKIYTWSRIKGKPIKFENNQPGYLHLAPHIVVYLKSYKVDDKVIPVLGTVDLLYNYYRNFTKSLNKNENEPLKNISLELTQNLTSDEEKIKAIFYWVKDNIKYVAFENGYEGFIPREGSLVNERRFGDCKDMSSIITSMASYIGLKNVHLCWIGTRNIPYSYAEVATPAADDHMIASVDLHGKTIFLDATDKETAFGLPTGFIQGKEALVQYGNDFKVIEVPVVDAAINLKEDHLKIKSVSSHIEGSGLMRLHGLTRSDFLNRIGDASNNNRFEIVKKLVLKGSNKFKLKSYNEANIADRDLPYDVDYQFSVENYLITAGNDAYLSIFLSKPFEDHLIEKDRESKYEFEHLVQYKLTIEYDIPNDKKVVTIPQNLIEENDLIKYDIKFTQEEDKIILHLDVSNKKLLLDQKDFNTWNEAIKKLKSKYSETIVLKNK